MQIKRSNGLLVSDTHAVSVLPPPVFHTMSFVAGCATGLSVAYSVFSYWWRRYGVGGQGTGDRDSTARLDDETIVGDSQSRAVAHVRLGVGGGLGR